MAELAKDKTASRQEVVIPLTVRGIVTFLRKTCFDQPVELVGIGADKAERLSQRMMSGRFAIVTMPAGIILRNASRTVLGSTSEEKSAWWGAFSGISGTIGAVGAMYLGTKAMAGILGGTIVGSTVGTWGSLVVGAIITAPVMLPAFSVAFLAGTAAAAGVIATLSVVPAIANLGVSFKRTVDAWKGIKYDDSILQANTSLSDKLRDRRENKVISAFYALPGHKVEKVYVDLQQRFATAAARNARAQAAATPAAAPQAAVKEQRI